MKKIFFVLFFVFLTCNSFAAGVPKGAIEGKIAEVRADQHWLSIYSSYGLLFLVLHPQGLVFREGGRVDLSAFKPGEDVVVIPGGIRSGNTLLILALEDWKTYEDKTGAFPHPFQPSSTTLPPKKFMQVDGKVVTISPSDKMFWVETKKGERFHVQAQDRTKIYTYTKGQFILLSFDKLLLAEWVRVGGFGAGSKELRAESVLVFSEAPH